MRNPAHSHRLHGDLPKNGATDVAAASGASAKMLHDHMAWCLTASGTHAVLISRASPDMPQRRLGRNACWVLFGTCFGRSPGPVWGQFGTTSCTRVHAGPKSGQNGGSEATFAYSGQFGKISHTHPVKFQICIQIRVVKNGVRFCVKIWNDL